MLPAAACSAMVPSDGGAPPSLLGPARGAHRGKRVSRGAIAVCGAAVLLIAGALVAAHYLAPAGSGPAPHPGVIEVVAAENFWGSLIGQLGGAHVSVLSIVSDPNADPHDYETNTSDAVAIANAGLIIENGAGYDNWCSQLVGASNAPHQVVLNVANLLGKADGDNPHFWYGAPYVQTALGAMYGDLARIDPVDTGYYQHQYAALNATLATDIWDREAEIRAQFSGTQVASTESIFQYMANSTGLNLVSPYAFMSAVAEGNDPPADSVTLFQNQLESGNVSVLVYNEQTVTPLTDQMKAIAASHNLSVIGVTETIQPSNVSFEVWMEGELLTLQNALNQKVSGK